MDCNGVFIKNKANEGADIGASGKPIKFPTYWGNNAARGNIDYCMQDPAALRNH